MLLKVNLGGNFWLMPSTKWQTLKFNAPEETALSVDKNFYITVKDLNHQ
jgi:hypothetical protein